MGCVGSATLSPELADLGAEALVRHPVVLAAIGERLGRQDRGAASQAIWRIMLMAKPLSVDANEIAGKGYVNQAATRARRAYLVDFLYSPDPGPLVAVARQPS